MVEPNNFERETGRWGEGGRDYVVSDVFVKALVFSLFFTVFSSVQSLSHVRLFATP